MDVYALIKDRVAAIIDAYKQAMADGDLQFIEGVKLIFFVGSSFMELARSLAPDLADKAAVKEAVAKAIHLFYVEVIKPYNIPGVPAFLEKMIENVVEGAIDPVVDQAVDFLYDLLGSFAPAPDAPNVIGSEPADDRLTAAAILARGARKA